MRLIGIDRGRGVWVVAEADEQLEQITLGIVEDLIGYLRGFNGSECRVVIDVPIGLPDSGPRRVDREARRLVGGRRASAIFPVPVRAALAGQNYEAASNLNFQASGKRLSKQTYGILDGIRDLDRIVSPGQQEWLREGHPEVTFAILSGGSGLEAAKKTPEGAATRAALLGRYLKMPDVINVRLQLGRKHVGTDDVLDALAMLVSASRLARGEAVVLPGDAIEHDRRGLRMEMVV